MNIPEYTSIVDEDDNAFHFNCAVKMVMREKEEGESPAFRVILTDDNYSFCNLCGKSIKGY